MPSQNLPGNAESPKLSTMSKTLFNIFFAVQFLVISQVYGADQTSQACEEALLARVVLKTPSLEIRQPYFSEVEEMVTIVLDERVTAMLEADLSYDQMKWSYDRSASLKESSFIRYDLAIIHEGKVIGIFMINQVHEGWNKKPDFLALSEGEIWIEVGYVIAPTKWGRGFATEALKVAIDFAFKELNAHGLVGETAHKNNPSKRVLMKAGFEAAGSDEENDYFLLRKRSFE